MAAQINRRQAPEQKSLASVHQTEPKVCRAKCRGGGENEEKATMTQDFQL